MLPEINSTRQGLISATTYSYKCIKDDGDGFAGFGGSWDRSSPNTGEHLYITGQMRYTGHVFCGAGVEAIRTRLVNEDGHFGCVLSIIHLWKRQWDDRTWENFPKLKKLHENGMSLSGKVKFVLDFRYFATGKIPEIRHKPDESQVWIWMIQSAVPSFNRIAWQWAETLVEIRGTTK